MSRLRIAWLACLALMALGSVFAHALAYKLAAPAHGSHARMNHPHDSGVFPHVEVCLAVCGAVALLVLAASLLDRLRSTRALVAPLWVFALVPPLGFVLQEHLEHALQTGALPLTAFAEPTFALGLVLQIPFALAAFGLARALLALAQALVERLRTSPRLRVVSPEPRLLPARVAGLPLLSALASGHGQRAPPLPAR